MERSELRDVGYRLSAVAAIVLLLCAARFGPLWLLGALAIGWMAWRLRPSAEDLEAARQREAKVRILPPKKMSPIRRDLMILFWLVVLSPVIFVGGWMLAMLIGKP